MKVMRASMLCNGLFITSVFHMTDCFSSMRSLLHHPISYLEAQVHNILFDFNKCSCHLSFLFCPMKSVTLRFDSCISGATAFMMPTQTVKIFESDIKRATDKVFARAREASKDQNVSFEYICW